MTIALPDDIRVLLAGLSTRTWRRYAGMRPRGSAEFEQR
jgi:hypothetical protein